MCIYSTPDAEEYVTLRGHANIRDEESIWPETQTIVERYMEPEHVAALMRDLRTEERVLISLTPDRIIFKAIEA